MLRKLDEGSATSALTTGRVQKVTTGNSYTCAVLRDLNVYCWGQNLFSILGNVGTNSPVPVKVIGSEKNISDFSSGAYHSCYISNQKVYCWGGNSEGQLGTGNFTSVGPANATAVNIPPAQKVLAAMGFTCAIASGDVYCWGNNFGYAIGINKEVSEQPFVGYANNWTSPGNWYIPTPQKVLNVNGRAVELVKASNSMYGTCAILNDNSTMCWGYTYTPSMTNPSVIANLAGAREIQNGNLFGCSLSSGALKCFGTNLFGNYGNGQINTSGQFVTPNGMDSGVTVFGVGGNYACAYKDKIYCWGKNDAGQLSTGDMQDSLVPKAATHPAGIVQQIAAGYWHNCFLISGDVYCNGKNDQGQLGTNNYTPQYNSATRVLFP